MSILYQAFKVGNQTDCIIYTTDDGETTNEYKLHKLILSLSSEYFRTLFTTSLRTDSTIAVSKHTHFEFIISYIYDDSESVRKIVLGLHPNDLLEVSLLLDHLMIDKSAFIDYIGQVRDEMFVSNNNKRTLEDFRTIRSIIPYNRFYDCSSPEKCGSGYRAVILEAARKRNRIPLDPDELCYFIENYKVYTASSPSQCKNCNEFIRTVDYERAYFKIAYNIISYDAETKYKLFKWLPPLSVALLVYNLFESKVIFYEDIFKYLVAKKDYQEVLRLFAPNIKGSASLNYFPVEVMYKKILNFATENGISLKREIVSENPRTHQLDKDTLPDAYQIIISIITIYFEKLL